MKKTILHNVQYMHVHEKDERMRLVIEGFLSKDALTIVLSFALCTRDMLQNHANEPYVGT